MSPAFSPRDLSDRWKCSERHVRNLIRDGKLRAIRVGKRGLRIRAEDIERFDGSPQIDTSPITEKELALMPRFEPTAYSAPPPPTKFVSVFERVYVIRVCGFVKIGWSTCPQSRLETFSSNMPFDPELLFTMKGGQPVEQQLHEQFSAYRHKGEWFRYEGELRAWVEAKLGGEA